MRSLGSLGMAGLVCVLACGCGTESSAGTPSTSDAGGVDAGGADQSSVPDLGKKLPGPCAITLVIGAKEIPDYVRYKYDSKGRRVDAHTWADAKKHTFTHTWSWDGKGRLAAEQFETSGPEPNIDFQFAYSADGKLSKKTGSMSGYKELECIYEFTAAGGKVSLEQCTRTWEVFDDEGDVIDTQSDKYLVAYSYGDKFLTEEYMQLNASSPDKTVWKSFDDKGRLIKMEVDYSTRGYAEERTSYTWDEQDNLLTEVFDADADGTGESTMAHGYDTYGNLRSSKFSHGDGFPADTTDPLELKATPYELVAVYTCTAD